MMRMDTRHSGRKTNQRSGFSLVELLVATLILAFTFAGIIISYFRCLELNELSQNSTIAVHALETKMAEIKNTPFALIVGNHDNTDFTTVGLNGRGAVYVDNSNADLFEITLTFSWQQSNGRIVGEDTNINGLIDGGEDLNGNGVLDSPASLVSYIFQQ